LFDASYIAIASNGCYTSCSSCVLVNLYNLPLCTLRWEFVKQGHLLVCLAPVGLLAPTLENPSFHSRIKFRYSQQPSWYLLTLRQFYFQLHSLDSNQPNLIQQDETNLVPLRTRMHVKIEFVTLGFFS
jgi:hypothetical protein